MTIKKRLTSRAYSLNFKFFIKKFIDDSFLNHFNFIIGVLRLRLHQVIALLLHPAFIFGSECSVLAMSV